MRNSRHSTDNELFQKPDYRLHGAHAKLTRWLADVRQETPSGLNHLAFLLRCVCNVDVGSAFQRSDYLSAYAKPLG